MATVIPIDSMRKSQLEASYRARFQPKNLLEYILVKQLAHDHWRLLVCQSRGPQPPDDFPDGAVALLSKAA